MKKFENNYAVEHKYTLEELEMNDMNKLLKSAEIHYGLKIENKSKEDIILFSTPFHQPFYFQILILFSGITGKEQFIMNVPALNIKDVSGFAKEVKKVSNIIEALNKELERLKEKRSEKVS